MMINGRNRSWALSARTAGVCRCGLLFVRVANGTTSQNPANAISRRLGWVLADRAEVGDPRPQAAELVLVCGD
jgi:hypothetical protein